MKGQSFKPEVCNRIIKNSVYTCVWCTYKKIEVNLKVD